MTKKETKAWHETCKRIRAEYPNHPRNHSERPISERGGCKVRWETFATREEAEKVSKWAIVEAEIKSRMGYDSGYCSPGSIEEKKTGVYEVCIL